MIRALVVLSVSWVALHLAELAAWLAPPLPPRAAPVPPPPPATLKPDLHAAISAERFITEMPSLSYAKVDAVLGYALGAKGSGFIYGHFSKQADDRWRQ